MNKSIAGHDAGSFDASGFVVSIRDLSPGFPNEKHARGHVPRFELELPERVKSTTCHISEVYCG